MCHISCLRARMELCPLLLFVLCAAVRWTLKVWSRNSSFSPRGRAAPGYWYGSGKLTVASDGFALVLTVCVCVCVVAALGAGQLHQPREQRGDREDVAGGTVSFPLPRGNFILALL